MAGVIDIHGHGVPPSLIDEVRKRGGSYGGIRVDEAGDGPVFTFPGAKPLPPVMPGMMDIESRRGWLARYGVAAQLAAPWLDMQGCDLDPEPGVRWVTFVNEAMAEWCRESGGTLHPLASLHLADATAAAEELRRAVADLGCVGAMIPTHHRYGSIGIDGWEPLWEVAEQEQVPIILHPTVHGPTCLAGREATLGFRSLWGRLMDTTILAQELLLGRLFERYPHVRVVLVHGGGYLPYQAARIDGEVTRGRVTSSLESGPPSAQVGRFYFDTALMSSAAISLLVTSYGAEHVLMGSDYPFFASIVDPCAQLAAALDDRARTVVGRDSALRLFPRLQPPAER